MGAARPIEEDISQQRQAELLTSTGNGPTVDNETELLEDAFGPADDHGIYGAPAPADDSDSADEGGNPSRPRMLGGNTGGLEEMIQAMEGWLGLGEPNVIQEWYRQRNGNDYAGNFAWCNATITRAAYDSDNYQAVCFDTDWAYTVAHAARFNTDKQWTAMTNGILKSGIRRGDIVFFDWDGTSEIGKIDHVGIVTSVSTDGKYVYTIEGNTANVCARRVRVVHDIAGYGRPKYPTAGTTTSTTPARYQVTINGLPYGYGAKGSHITTVGEALVRAGFGKHYMEGPGPEWGDADTRNYSDFQKSLGYKGTASGQDADGVPGASTLKALLGTLPAPLAKPAAPKPTAPAYEPFPGKAFFHGGRHSPIITALGRRLVVLGYGKHYRTGPGPNWTNADRDNVRDFQRAQGWTGDDADGYPGPETWKRLKVPKV
ncbi:peptidoglycan-binding protein [Streptomyces longwoodensis]|uniref:peptidoglycan-binding protein n=1 Tax=Streptomyces longwoodensis TaxID=68231 RepID=UPI0022574476|nr:peptidoglycan-binding protein [Streptomyces longwoodensis]MCX5000979.1 peptidoglycan-binding protein [Streptomyces longwoodensis]